MRDPRPHKPLRVPDRLAVPVKKTNRTLDIGGAPVAPAPSGSQVSHPNSVRIAFDGASLVQSSNGAAYAPITPTVVFGADYQTVEERAKSTTISATFQTKATLTTPALTGDYVYTWQALVDQTSAASQIEVRLWNVTGAFSMGQWQLVQPTNPIERIFTGGTGEFPLAAASVTFEIQWRALGGNTAGIEDAVIQVWRVS